MRWIRPHQAGEGETIHICENIVWAWGKTNQAPTEPKAFCVFYMNGMRLKYKLHWVCVTNPVTHTQGYCLFSPMTDMWSIKKPTAPPHYMYLRHPAQQFHSLEPPPEAFPEALRVVNKPLKIKVGILEILRNDHSTSTPDWQLKRILSTFLLSYHCVVLVFLKCTVWRRKEKTESLWCGSHGLCILSSVCW